MQSSKSLVIKIKHDQHLTQKSTELVKVHCIFKVAKLEVENKIWLWLYHSIIFLKTMQFINYLLNEDKDYVKKKEYETKSEK